jgi:hypothetical protein
MEDAMFAYLGICLVQLVLEAAYRTQNEQETPDDWYRVHDLMLAAEEWLDTN